MWYLWFVIGIICGSIVTNVIFAIKSASGVLRVDRTNPEKDLYRFEINDLDAISKKKLITLRIDNHADLSQK